MNDILQVKISLDNISNVKDLEKLRFNLYACYTGILLSRDLFDLNKDTISFLEKSGFEFKEYVFASRTTIVSRVIRRIEGAKLEELLDMRDEAIKYVFSIDSNSILKNKNSKNKNKKNEFDSILEQFGE